MAVCDITVLPGKIDKNIFEKKFLTEYLEVEKKIEKLNLSENYEKVNNITYKFVDCIIDEIRKSGLKYEVGAMSTTVEGNIEELLSLIKLLHDKAFKLGANDVIILFRLHSSKIYDDTIKGKTIKYRQNI